MSDKYKLLEFIANLTPEEAAKLAANLSKVSLALQEPAPPFPPEYFPQTEIAPYVHRINN